MFKRPTDSLLKLSHCLSSDTHPNFYFGLEGVTLRLCIISVRFLICFKIHVVSLYHNIAIAFLYIQIQPHVPWLTRIIYVTNSNVLGLSNFI